MRWIKGVGLGQQRSPQQVKPKYNKRAHTNGRKGNIRASRQGDHRDHTTVSHRTPATEVHPTETASKAEHREAQKQAKRDINMIYKVIPLIILVPT